MSESMVERVAAALWAAGFAPRKDAERMARAAIEAMREPTDLMGYGLPPGYRPGSHSAAQVWRAMIDAALT